MSTNKIFFHSGAPCHGCANINELWSALDKEKIPFAAYSVDGGGLIAVDAAKYTNADHILIYRTTATDVADYAKSPEDAAVSTWTLLMYKLPPEIKAIRGRVWVEIGNEQDKNRADWLGHYYVALGKLALNEGYRICGPGWSTGEPEPEHWETAGWRAYLTLCQQNPDRLAISCHEYSLDANNIEAGYPWLVGRFQFLLDACRKMGIAPPQIFVTEAGWVHNDMPVGKAAENQIKQLAELYAQHPSVKAAFLWSLIGGGDKKELAAKLNAQIPFVSLYTLTASFPDPTPPTPPQPEPPPNSDQYKGAVVLLPPTLSEAEALQIYRQRLPRRNTIAFSWDDARHALANPRWLPDSELIVFGLMRWPKEIRQEILALRPTVYAVPGTEPQPAPEPTPAPFDGLQFGRPLDTNWVITSPFNAPRDYSSLGGKENDRHEGVDVAPTVSGVSHVLAVYDGKVTAVKTSRGYGNYVIVESSYNGKIFYTWRAHMQSVSVVVGQQVKRGDVLGICGATGNATGRHDHLTMTSAHGSMAGYIVAGVVDPTSFYPSPSAPMPEPAAIDLLPYLRGDGRQYELQYTWNGGGTHPCQTQHAAENTFYIVKGGGEYEMLYYDENYIYRGEDTSEAPDKFYVQTTNGQYGAMWCKRRMAIGETVTKRPLVIHYWKDGCKERLRGQPTDNLTLKAHYPSMTFPSGITVQDVIRLEWAAGEAYLFARGHGLVGFEFAGGKSYISEIHQGRPDLERKVLACFKPGERYYARD